MLDMRLRIPELMEEHGLKNAYQLAKASGGRIPMTSAYRLVESKGRPGRIDLDTLQALCDVFDCDPGELLERESKRRKSA